jgi:hypothetical protein
MSKCEPVDTSPQIMADRRRWRRKHPLKYLGVARMAPIHYQQWGRSDAPPFLYPHWCSPNAAWAVVHCCERDEADCYAECWGWMGECGGHGWAYG